jgi:hypothetical protein
MSWLWLLISGVSLLAAIALVRQAEAFRLRSSLVSYTLRFPRGLPAENVAAFFAGWTGSLPPWWKRQMFGVPFLVCEVHADRSGITHRLQVPAAWTATVESLLSAHLPGVRYERDQHHTGHHAAPHVLLGAEYRLSTSDRPLDVDPAALSVRLLASLQPLRGEERVVVQFVLGSAGPVQPARLANKAEQERWLVQTDSVMLTSEAVTALKAKQSSALLVSVGRIGAHASDGQRANQLLRHVESAWHGTRAPGVHLRRRWLPPRLVGQRIESRTVPVLAWPGGVINAVEAAGLTGFPVGIEQLPGLPLGTARLLPIPAGLPRRGTVIGVGTYPSTRRPLALAVEARTRHLHVVGPTGTGKTVLLAHLAVSDLDHPGRALVVVDPKDGGLVDAVLARLSDGRLDDVVVLDPTDTRPVGFDPLRSTPATRELVVDRIVGIMGSIWRSSWGPRSADLIRHAMLTLTQVPGMTLCEAPALLSDPGFRQRILNQVNDPVGVGPFWAWFNALSTAEQSSIVAPPLNKLRAFTTRSAVRHVIGQASPAVDLERTLNHGGVLLVRLPSGLLGEETASLLGALLVNQLWQATSARAGIPVDRRRPAMVILDEVQSLLRLPGAAIDDLLTQARGYRVGLTLAHQHLHQLPADLRQTTLANCRSKVVFACSRDDAGVFAREFGTSLTPDDLMGLEAFEALVAAYADGRTQSPATVRTLPSSQPVRDAEVVKQRSRQRHGTNRAAVEQAIQARLRPSQRGEGGDVGRRRRGQT